MKRLLLITERFTPDIGGVARSATRIVTSLCTMGVQVDVLTWSRYLQPGELSPCEKIGENCQVYRIGLYRHWDMTMPHTVNVMEWLQQTHGYDLIWGHYLFPSGFLAVWFGKLQGIRSIVSARGNDIDKEMFPPGDFARLRWTLEQSNLLTVVSADMGRKLSVLSGRDDVIVLKNTIDSNIFTPAPGKRELAESLGIIPGEVVLGFCGELRQKKGQQFLLSALTRVREKYPACLLIIGEVRASQESMLQTYRQQYPEDGSRIIITGHSQDSQQVAEYLQLVDVYLQPSLWEGMPNALLEAMGCGCVCIGSDAGGIPEVIFHGENGFILRRSHLHQLGEAVLEYLQLSEGEKQRIKAAARRCIVKEYSLNQEKQQLWRILDLGLD
ncbi:glycosyltransferase family 4 protein [Calothrix sp. 336/3]|uniref:glycosyltransferase family 4 protein n=1 Tax=Calothrix sp. 336/3 TaxID=1337936 RepID=UPI0004E3D961|nr:glycosyltransferase family 4 protein [Calothrix sp. 336/3]AKG20448.1 glycosyl transferase family 1 [Calothrix sp. 336/3]